jgi:hypothetical protein
MSSNNEIHLAFFNKKIDQMEVVKIENDIIYDFHLEDDKLRIIINRLKSLPPTFCILCQIKYIMGKNASIRLLFTNLLSNYPDFVYTGLTKQYVNDTEYIVCGTLEQNLLALTPAFISRLKANKMIGVCFISVKLFEKITTWIEQKRYLADVLRRPHVTFEQSELPTDFEYTPDSLNTLCAEYDKEPKDCALHIFYAINNDGNVRKPLFDRTILAQSDINLSITITCGIIDINRKKRKVISSLCSIIEDLRNTIYSLEIDFSDLYLIRGSEVTIALSKIPNLKILKLSYGYIQWKYFLDCLKGIKTLEELDLSNIRMFTDLRGSDDDTDFDVEDFRTIWSQSLKDLKGLRIAGSMSILSGNENADDNQLDLVETVLPCLEDFTQLQSFGFTSDPD